MGLFKIMHMANLMKIYPIDPMVLVVFFILVGKADIRVMQQMHVYLDSHLRALRSFY